MRKKHYSQSARMVLLSCLSFVALTSSAEERQLQVKTSNGTTAIAFADLSKITFKDGNMVVKTKDAGEQTFVFSELKSLTFTGDAAGIEKVEAGANLNEAGTRIYSVSGVLQTGDLNSLSNGIYIIKQGNKVKKIYKK